MLFNELIAGAIIGALTGFLSASVPNSDPLLDAKNSARAKFSRDNSQLPEDLKKNGIRLLNSFWNELGSDPAFSQEMIDSALIAKMEREVSQLDPNAVSIDLNSYGDNAVERERIAATLNHYLNDRTNQNVREISIQRQISIDHTVLQKLPRFANLEALNFAASSVDLLNRYDQKFFFEMKNLQQLILPMHLRHKDVAAYAQAVQELATRLPRLEIRFVIWRPFVKDDERGRFETRFRQAAASVMNHIGPLANKISFELRVGGRSIESSLLMASVDGNLSHASR